MKAPSRNPHLDALDRALVQMTQSGLPLTPEPYRAVADALGLSVTEVKRRFQVMLDRGVVRRIAAVPNHYRLGFQANGMSVWDIADCEVSTAGREIAELDFVTHCYKRPRRAPAWPYNLFAMVHGNTYEEVYEKVATIAERLGSRFRAHDVLFSTRILKKTGLRLAAGG